MSTNKRFFLDSSPQNTKKQLYACSSVFKWTWLQSSEQVLALNIPESILKNHNEIPATKGHLQTLSRLQLRSIWTAVMFLTELWENWDWTEASWSRADFLLCSPKPGLVGIPIQDFVEEKRADTSQWNLSAQKISREIKAVTADIPNPPVIVSSQAKQGNSWQKSL